MSPNSFDEPLRLLVVDDDEVDRATIRRHLAASGVRATIDEASDARDLVAQLAADSYDCLILDHHLPGETSVEVIARVRAAELHTPILCVTGQDEEVGAASVAAGASDFLSKVDLSPSRLSRRLRYVLRLGRAEREARRIRAALEAQRRMLDAVIAQLPTGLVVIDVDHGGVLVTNARAEELVGVGGRALADDDTAPALFQARQVLADAARTGATVSGESTVSHRGRELRLGATPVIVDTGRTAMLVIDDVTDEVAALRRAERAVHARDDVLAIVSHDMRGPLSAIGIALDGLRDPDLEVGLRERCVSAVQRSVERAERLIRDLLFAHQLEVKGVQVELRNIDVRELLERVMREHELVAGQDRTKLEVDVAPDVGTVRADRDRLAQAFANLIGNALRHARGTASIELGAHRRTDGTIALTVRDHGPGVALDALPHVFDRYWQGRHRRGGAGLGLAIVRGIAQAHGGDATVRNHPDGGAEFTIALPAR